MKDRLSKPKVFLSHSALDKEFINRLAVDLRKCQIEPWLDTEEIRDGRLWLKVIFEDGIPTCDAVIIYLTENSLKSKMVAKELDATLVEQLGESGITLLPYVSNSELRGRLRPDIRSLHCREWDQGNYDEILPSVVAEVWRSFTERVVNSATVHEKNRRLELELELKKVQEKYESTVFTGSEEREFQYLLSRLDRHIDITFSLYQHMPNAKSPIKIANEIYRVHMLSAVIEVVKKGSHFFDLEELEYHLTRPLNQKHPLPDKGFERYGNDPVSDRIDLELQICGLVKHAYKQVFGGSESAFEFTDKMHRFRFWLDYYGRTPEINFELVSKVEVPIPKVPEPKEEFLGMSTIKEIDRKVNFKARYNRWHTSEEGVASARLEFESLCNELEGKVKRSNRVSETFHIDFRREGQNKCRVSGVGVSLSVEWKCEQADTLEGSVLSVSGHKTVFDMEGVQSYTDEGGVYSGELDIKWNKDFKVMWQRREDNYRFSSEELASSLIATLAKEIDRRVSP